VSFFLGLFCLLEEGGKALLLWIVGSDSLSFFPQSCSTEYFARRRKTSLVSNSERRLDHFDSENIRVRLACVCCTSDAAATDFSSDIAISFGMSRLTTMGADDDAGTTNANIGPIRCVVSFPLLTFLHSFFSLPPLALTSKFDPVEPRWMAPEAIMDRKYSKKTDAWAFGVVMFELATQEIPYSGHSPAQIAAKVPAGRLALKLPEDVASKLRSVFARCLEPDDKERPDFKEIVADLSDNASSTDESSSSTDTSANSDQYGAMPEAVNGAKSKKTHASRSKKVSESGSGSEYGGLEVTKRESGSESGGEYGGLDVTKRESGSESESESGDEYGGLDVARDDSEYGGLDAVRDDEYGGLPSTPQTPSYVQLSELRTESELDSPNE
jgi:Protein tyrosine and serine/threonine kinase